MKKILIIIFIMLIIEGCTDKTSITEVVNDFKEAYNRRDAQACLSLFFVNESDKAEQLDGTKPGTLQHFCNVYPSTPTISSIQITEIADFDGSVSVLTDFYTVGYDTSVVYSGLTIKASAEDDVYSARFTMTETSPGILGLFSTWKIISVSGIPGIWIEPFYY